MNMPDTLTAEYLRKASEALKRNDEFYKSHSFRFTHVDHGNGTAYSDGRVVFDRWNDPVQILTTKDL